MLLGNLQSNYGLKNPFSFCLETLHTSKVFEGYYYLILSLSHLSCRTGASLLMDLFFSQLPFLEEGQFCADSQLFHILIPF